MNNRDLRALFTVGGARLSAEEVFTNRVTEVEAFQGAVNSFLERPSSDSSYLSPVVDVSIPRANVLTFYGIGGIGKSTLSRHLEDRLERNKSEQGFRSSAVRIDFEDSASLDLENIILRMRATLGGLAPRWPAFDIAFGLYWERRHPGEPLTEFISNDSRLRRMSRRVGLSKQIEDGFHDVAQAIEIPSATLSAAGGVARAIYDQILNSARKRKLVSGCPFFQPLIESDADDETLSYLPSLMAWDLESAQKQDRVVAVAFFDTFEVVTNRTTRDLERNIQRIAFVMPNVLFVITGRNRLDWAELSPPAELDYVGVSRWPQLSITNLSLEPRQHLVGFLSQTDCDEYLRSALTQDQIPAMSQAIRMRIAEGSSGLPLYLDLSVAYYCDILGSGGTPTPADFGGPLPAIVVRIMRDMGSDERALLRAAALLATFDDELLRVTAGGVPDAAVGEFVARPFVQHTVEQGSPYALHMLLQEAVRGSDHQLRDRWSAREWKTSAERAYSLLSRRSAELAERKDRLQLAACFAYGARLASEFELDPSWVVDTGNTLAEMGAWTTLDLLPAATEGSLAAALRAGFRGIALRRSGSLEESISELAEALSSPSLSSPSLNTRAVGVFQLRHAHSIRNSGRYDQAEEIYQQIYEAQGRFATHAQVQLADISLLKGRFDTAMATLEILPEDKFMRGEALRIRGHVYRVNGQFMEAESSYRRAFELAQSINSLALQGKAMTNLAETYCWERPDEALPMANEAIEFNTRVGNRLEVLKALSAKALSEQGAGYSNRAALSLSSSLELVSSSGYRAGTVFALVSEVFLALLMGRSEDAESAYQRMENVVREIGVYAFWLMVAGWWLDSRITGNERAAYAVNWLQGESGARATWVRTLENRTGDELS
ncbi:MAG: tetratricopeptide repeat protein [Pseudonocardia sp.]